MNREEILKAIKPYFSIEELVCDHVLSRFGERAWDFLDTDLLHTILVIRRDIIKQPMWCNSKTAHQRGLRCNLCQIVKTSKIPYLTAHVQGKAVDLTVTGMKAEAAREKIKANAHLLPVPIRLEKGVSWLHIDTRNYTNQKVYEFTA